MQIHIKLVYTVYVFKPSRPPFVYVWKYFLQIHSMYSICIYYQYLYINNK